MKIANEINEINEKTLKKDFYIRIFFECFYNRRFNFDFRLDRVDDDP